MNQIVRIHVVLVMLAMALSLSGSLRAQPSHTEIATPPLRVMSFNIRVGTAPDGADDWPHRRALASDAIRGFAPQLLALQEALRFQLDQLRSDLREYDEIGVGRDDGQRAGEYSAILYDRHRLELLEQGTFWFSDTPAVAGSMTWGNQFPRLCTWGHFRDRVSGNDFYLYNQHWDHESQPSRERSAALLLDRVAARGTDAPVLISGDFNAEEDNPAFQALLHDPRTKLIDSFRQRNPDRTLAGTFHGFHGAHDGPRIDAILAESRWQVLDADIVGYSRQEHFPSDHFPVTAVVRIPPRPPYVRP